MFKLFILTKNGMLSVNQTVAQIKLTELWKATHTDNNPLKFTRIAPAENGRNSRAVTNKKLYQSKGSTLTMDSFVYDATKMWNNAPDSIKNANSIYSAKTEIKSYCKLLPL